MVVVNAVVRYSKKDKKRYVAQGYEIDIVTDARKRRQAVSKLVECVREHISHFRCEPNLVMFKPNNELDGVFDDIVRNPKRYRFNEHRVFRGCRLHVYYSVNEKK